MARKVVGVGSVGTQCWIVLMLGRRAEGGSWGSTIRPKPGKVHLLFTDADPGAASPKAWMHCARIRSC